MTRPPTSLFPLRTALHDAADRQAIGAQTLRIDVHLYWRT
jgi:hypothetical protein